MKEWDVATSVTKTWQFRKLDKWGVYYIEGTSIWEGKEEKETITVHAVCWISIWSIFSGSKGSLNGTHTFVETLRIHYIPRLRLLEGNGFVLLLSHNLPIQTTTLFGSLEKAKFLRGRCTWNATIHSFSYAETKVHKFRRRNCCKM